MFASANQLFYFLESAFIGVVIGLIFEVVNLLQTPIKSVVFRHIADFMLLPIICVLFFWGGEIFRFPDFRLYLFIGVAVGFLLERISFHKSLAKFYQIVYNKTISFIRRIIRDGRKKTKACRSRNGGGNSCTVRPCRRVGLAVYLFGRKTKEKGRA